MSFIADGVTIALKVLGIGLLIFVVFLIIVAVINWYVDSQEILHRNVEIVAENVPKIVDQVVKSCEIIDNTMNTLDETLAQNLQHEVARELASKLLDENKLSECEWYEFVNHLNDWEKRKLKVYDLVCDFSSCIKQP